VYGNMTPTQIAQSWCEQQDVRVSEVILVALMVAKRFRTYQEVNRLYDNPTQPDSSVVPSPTTRLVASFVFTVASIMAAAVFAVKKLRDRASGPGAEGCKGRGPSKSNHTPSLIPPGRGNLSAPKIPPAISRATCPAPPAGGATKGQCPPAVKRVTFAEEIKASGEIPATSAESMETKHFTWEDYVSKTFDAVTPFQKGAVISFTGVIHAASEAFSIEAHEACELSRFMKNKKTDIVIGGRPHQVLQRQDSWLLLGRKGASESMFVFRSKTAIVIAAFSRATLPKEEARIVGLTLQDNLIKMKR
jgi:hypothetical protein